MANLTPNTLPKCTALPSGSQQNCQDSTITDDGTNVTIGATGGLGVPNIVVSGAVQIQGSNGAIPALEVAGGTGTSLDQAAITTDGTGNMTVATNGGTLSVGNTNNAAGLTVWAGYATTTLLIDTSGNVTFDANSVTMQNQEGPVTFDAAVINMQNLPTEDPHAAGQLFMTGYVQGASPGTLMVSAG